MKPPSIPALAFLLATAACSNSAQTEPTSPSTPAPPAPPLTRAIVRIEAIDHDPEAKPAETTWLGVYTEEISEALAAQLDLKSGEGLLINYVAPDSPAAKAGFAKNDVLTTMGDQLLVHPTQLAKLIRAHKEGDNVKLTCVRAGKKQTLSATLAKRANLVAASPDSQSLEWIAAPGDSDFHGAQVRTIRTALAPTMAAPQHVKLEVQKHVEEARKALESALLRNSSAGAHSPLAAEDLEALAQATVTVGDDATTLIEKETNTKRSIIKTDSKGTYVLVADPKKRLRATDKDGKLLFDGEIETEADQQKVPPAVWEKAKPLLQKLTSPEFRKPQANAEDSQPGKPESADTTTLDQDEESKS